MRGHIQRRGKKSWRLKFDVDRDPDTGKRLIHYVTVRGARADAEKELRKQLSRIDKGIIIEPTKTTVAEYLDTWLDDVAPDSVGPKALERYRGLARNQINPDLGAIQLQRLRPRDIKRWHRKLIDAGDISTRTICHAHGVLRKALAELKVDAKGLSKLATLYCETAQRRLGSAFKGDMRVVVKALRMAKAQKITVAEAVDELAIPFVEKNDRDAEWGAVKDRISDKIDFVGINGPGWALQHFQDDLPDRILELNLSDDDLLSLSYFFWAACNVESGDNHGCLYSVNATALVNNALDVMETKKVNVAKAIEQASTPEIKKWRAEREKEDERKAEEEERPWKERKPFEFFAEYLIGQTNYAFSCPIDYTGVDLLRRHTKNCGLTKLEAAVEKHLAKAEAKDAA